MADPIDLVALQKRTLRVLIGGQFVGAAAMSAAVTVGAFVIQQILGSKTPWVGLSTATFTLGSALMSQQLARVMSIKGRRIGLQYGYCLAILGGVTAGLGANYSSLLLFVIGLFLYGSGQASNLLSRYAAMDLALPGQSSQAMSYILFGSTFGAIFGPVLIAPFEKIGQYVFGWSLYTGPWIGSACFFGCALVNIAVRLRPDPLIVSRGLVQANGSIATTSFSAVFKTIAASAQAKFAVFAMIISQTTMVSVMTMTPVHLKFHGHETVSAYVISLHIAGMYAFSPLVGKFADRRGRVLTILVGAVVMCSATIVAALAGESAVLLFPSLWLLGIGWSFGLIGGSSLLVAATTPEQRVRVQGAADLMMSFSGCVAGFSSGFIRQSFGYHMLSNLGTVLALSLVIVALRNLSTKVSVYG